MIVCTMSFVIGACLVSFVIGACAGIFIVAILTHTRDD